MLSAIRPPQGLMIEAKQGKEYDEPTPKQTEKGM